MASFRSRAGIGGNGAGSLTTSLVVPKPAGTVDGDELLVAINIGFGTNAITITPPAGWTQLYSSGPISRPNGFQYFAVYARTASGEPASWTWTTNQQVAFFNCQAMAFSSVLGSTPYEQLSSTSSQPNAGGTLTRSATTAGPGRLLVNILMGGTGSGADPTFNEDVGTEQFDTAGAGGSFSGIALNTLDMPTATTQSVTGTINGSSSPLAFAFVQLALLPKVTAVTASDTGVSLSDSIARQKALARALVDTGTTFGESIRTGIRIFDTGVSFTELLTRPKVFRTLADTGAVVSDTLLRQKGYFRTMSDIGSSIADVVGGGNVKPKFITEVGASVVDILEVRYSATVPAPPPAQFVTDSAARLSAMLGDLQPELLEDPSVITILHTIATELQRFEEAADTARRGFWPLWSDDTYGILGLFEQLFGLPVAPAGMSLDQRRALIVAHFQKRVAGSGLDWELALTQAMGSTEYSYLEGPTPYTITIRYAFANGAPNSAQVQNLARQITPAHLAIVAGYSGGFLVGISLVGDPL